MAYYYWAFTEYITLQAPQFVPPNAAKLWQCTSKTYKDRMSSTSRNQAPRGLWDHWLPRADMFLSCRREQTNLWANYSPETGTQLSDVFRAFLFSLLSQVWSRSRSRSIITTPENQSLAPERLFCLSTAEQATLPLPCSRDSTAQGSNYTVFYCWPWKGLAPISYYVIQHFYDLFSSSVNKNTCS